MFLLCIFFLFLWSSLLLLQLHSQTVSDSSEKHVTCKHERHESKSYDESHYKVFESPDVIYPIKYKLGVKLGSKYTDHDFV